MIAMIARRWLRRSVLVAFLPIFFLGLLLLASAEVVCRGVVWGAEGAAFGWRSITRGSITVIRETWRLP